MFAMLCDQCGNRSEEYTGWWSCRECMDDVCIDCIVPNSNDDETGRALCLKCKGILDEQADAAKKQTDL